jgi:hypothetical protein
MELTPTTIVPFIRNQFPAFYNEEGGQFIAFVEAYYEWISQTQDRQVIANRDIDLTPDAFIDHFKATYLPDITFDTVTDKRLLVKNAIDIYRSKGTPRGIDLLMKLVYGAPANVIFPRDKLLSASVNDFVQPLYFEVSRSTRSSGLVGKAVTGSQSGATAYIESYSRQRTSTDSIDVLVISNISGHFVIGESIYNGTLYNDSPTIAGSTNSGVITNGGSNFYKYQVMSFASTRGSFGQAKVISVDATGAIQTIKIIESGIGFKNGETVNLMYGQGTTGAQMTVNLYSVGQKLGYSRGPQLEETHFHDNDYYQQYSYDIRSSIPFNKYADMMNTVMHSAGTRMFGSLLIENDIVLINSSDTLYYQSSVSGALFSLDFSKPVNSMYLTLLQFAGNPSSPTNPGLRFNVATNSMFTSIVTSDI